MLGKKMGVKNVGQEIGSEEMLGKKLGVDKCWVRKRELTMWGKKLGVRKQKHFRKLGLNRFCSSFSRNVRKPFFTRNICLEPLV